MYLMDAIILSIFVFVILFSFVEDYIPDWQKLIALAIVATALVCTAAFKPLTTTDAATYEYYFYSNDDELIELATEPSYIWLSRLILLFGGEVVVLFFIYAVLSIPIKFYTLWKTTPFVFTALIVYVGIYFPLHDVVQIRCGLATAFLLFSIIPLAKHQYWQSVALMLVAFFFHYSSLAFLPVILFGNFKINKYWKYALGVAIPCCLFLYILHIGAISFIPAAMIDGKLDLYKEMSESGDWAEYIPYKQLTFLAECALLYVFLFFYETIEKHCVYAPILIKVLVIEMVYLTMFTEIPVLGGRLHDLFGPFNALAFTCCLYCIKPRYIVRIGIGLFAFVHYIIQMLDNLYFP